MKVFISHRRTDSVVAMALLRRLQDFHGIPSYLDVIDDALVRPGEALADNLRRELSKCTQLLAVVSMATQQSWWVPWEIGIATEKEYPLATYADGRAELPEFLRKWPYLRSQSDLDKYAQASKSAAEKEGRLRKSIGMAASRYEATKEFYRALRSGLGQ